MKNFIVLISWMAFMVVFSTNIHAKSSVQSLTVEDSIHLWTSPDLFDIATSWVTEYNRIHSETKIIVSNVPANRVISLIEEPGNIGLITKDILLGSKNRSIWKMVVGRDIVVPVMNSENPFLEEVFLKGISPEEFAGVYSDTGIPVWGSLLNTDYANPVHCYRIRNESNKLYMNEFLQTDPSRIKGREFIDMDEMLKEIQKDKYSIGFCRLVDLLDLESQDIKEGVRIIPIDVNGNDKIDFIENIYTNTSSLERGVWIGKYPKVLFSNIYTVASSQPIKSNELAFLKWIITDGQQYLLHKGYSQLISSERPGKVQRLYANQLSTNDNHKLTQSNTLFFVSALVLFVFLIGLAALSLLKYKNEEKEADTAGTSKFFSESTVLAPNGLFFDKSHTWVFMEKDGFVRIGIADFLQHITGLITNVKMKSPGDLVKKGEPFLTIVQHGKQLNIDSPISGKIKEVNVRLEANSSMINSSPYSEGWVYIIESVSWLNEIKTYFMGETYRRWLNGEFLNLKNFFSSFIQLNVTNQLQQVIQDGGELNDGLMESFGPVIWEEFQTRFINRHK